jgi:hypothetical protein
MGIGTRIVKKSAVVILPLTLLSFVVDWRVESLRFLRIFGDPAFIPVSIVIGGLLGLANINGLIWSLERLLGSARANAKLVFVSMFRLLILFAVIIALTALKLINFLGMLTGMLVVFLVLIREAAHQAQKQSGE